MRQNIFTSYIIGNCLNFKTFFEPIIDFIEIGNPKEPPENRIYKFNFVQLRQNTQILVVTKTDICNRKFEIALFHPMILIFSYDNKK